MVKKKQPRPSKGIPVLIPLCAVVCILCCVFGFKLHALEHKHVVATPSIHVSLGGMEYTFDKGVPSLKTNDPVVTSLQSFLDTSAHKDLGSGCSTSYYTVTAYTADETQVLLHYGCGYPDANMYAVYTNSEWRFISPTNKFDTFGIPLCNYVDQNNINTAIAPVCLNASTVTTTGASYIVR